MGKRRKNKIHRQEHVASFDVDLSPLLALMVTLIPIMLLATVFVKVAVIETPIPQAVQKALNEDRKKKKREVNVHVYMKSNKYFNVKIDVDGKIVTNKLIKPFDKSWNFKSLHREIVKVKLANPKVFQLKLYPEADVPYSYIVKTMDEVRETQKGDKKVYIFDKETNKQVESKLMFPDVIFSNVMEG